MENQVTVNFNNQSYIATYNPQSGYYELELTAPDTGGVYVADVDFTDIFGQEYQKSLPIQILVKEPIKLETNKVFMWIFDDRTFSVVDILEIADYDITIDEETNANSIINVLKQTNAKANNIVAIKKNNEVVYWGIIDKIQQNEELNYQYTLKYITNLFDEVVEEGDELSLISTTGIEDYLAQTIQNHFISNGDTFINKTYLEVQVLTHTKLQISISNVENGLYNLHTWLTNCTQNYEIMYNFSIVNGKLVMTIGKNKLDKELIDVNAQPISNYNEVFETKIISTVIVKTDTGRYALYLLNDRTTTTNDKDPNRAYGSTQRVYTANIEDAPQTALNIFRQNSYNHNITFSYYERIIPFGTPIAIKTKDSLIYDTYISSVRITSNKFVDYVCGNIRIGFIEKIKQERSNKNA